MLLRDLENFWYNLQAHTTHESDSKTEESYVFRFRSASQYIQGVSKKVKTFSKWPSKNKFEKCYRQTKEMDTLFASKKSPAQTVWNLNTNLLLCNLKHARPPLTVPSGRRVFILSFLKECEPSERINDVEISISFNFFLEFETINSWKWFKAVWACFFCVQTAGFDLLN